MKTGQVVILVLASALPGGAGAAARDLLSLPLEELSRVEVEVEVATGTPKPLADTPAATSVLLPRDFRAMGAQTVEEALVAVPGLHVSFNGGLIGTTRFFIRGITSASNAQTLFMVNGIPTTTVLQGSSTPPFEAPLPIRMVERIEVIRGPGSALYGPDAFAGVINVITRDAESLRGGEAGASYGSFDTVRAHVAEGGSLGATQAAFFLAYDGTRGDRSIISEDAQTTLDNAPGNSAPPASLAPGPANRDHQRLDFYATLQRNQLSAHFYWRELWHVGTDQGFSGALDPRGEFGLRRQGADLTWRDSGRGAWDRETQLAWMRTGIRTPEPLRLLPPGAFGRFPEGVQTDFELQEDRTHLQFTALYHGWQAHRLRFGTGVTQNDLFESQTRRNYFYSRPDAPPSPYPQGMTDVSDTPDALVPERARTELFAFAQDEWAFARGWELTTGLRAGRYSDFGSVLTPRLALVWQTTPRLTSKLIYGEAFRAPAFIDLYATGNPLALGNPELEPERLRSAELGFSYRPAEHWSADLNLYEFRIRDFIDLLPSGSPATLMAQNAGRYRGRGAEAELAHQAHGFDIRANVSVQETKSEDSGAALGLAPDYQAYLRVGKSLPSRWELAGQLRHVGPRARQPGDGRPDLAGYTSLDLTLRHRLDRAIELFLLGRNVLDADRSEPGLTPLPERLPLPGASVAVGVEAEW